MESRTERSAQHPEDGEPFHALLDEWDQLRRLVVGYVRTYKDGLSAGARAMALKAALYGLMGIFAVAASAAAGFLVIWGLADTLAALVPLPLWGARLSAGSLFILLTLSGVYFFIRRQERHWASKRREEYRRFFEQLH